MITLLGVTDEIDPKSRTDINVVLDTDKRVATWIPRDLYVPEYDDRINALWCRGGLAAFMRGALSYGFNATQAVVVGRAASQEFLANVNVSVPVDRPLSFKYPLPRPADHPTKDHQQAVAEQRIYKTQFVYGHKVIQFTPPEEQLSGERVHQWIGARHPATKTHGGDFDRMRRQAVFLQELLKTKPDFSMFKQHPDVFFSPGFDFEGLTQLDATWEFTHRAQHTGLAEHKLNGRSMLFTIGDAASDAVLRAAGIR